MGPTINQFQNFITFTEMNQNISPLRILPVPETEDRELFAPILCCFKDVPTCCKKFKEKYWELQGESVPSPSVVVYGNSHKPMPKNEWNT